jgi:hypothetical protein
MLTAPFLTISSQDQGCDWKIVSKVENWGTFSNIELLDINLTLVFCSCYSKSLLLADFKENHTLLSCTKKSAKQENSSLFMNRILKNGNMRVENQTKTQVPEVSSLCPETLT